ncbi:hypothetical protein J6X04_02630 [Candidatus Saccharibacteria bacterium]|nr:hypothetical protein [Candidatus Saccharibacteria bacterium]
MSRLWRSYPNNFVYSGGVYGASVNYRNFSYIIGLLLVTVAPMPTTCSSVARASTRAQIAASSTTDGLRVV